MEPFKFAVGDKIVVVKDSLVSVVASTINIFDENGNFIEEVTDKDKKYQLLAIARSEKYDRMMFPNGHHTIILFDDGNKSVDEFEHFDHFKFLDRFFYLFKRKSDGLKLIGLEIGKERFVCIEDVNDPTRCIGNLMLEKKVKKVEKDIDIDPVLAKMAINVIEQIDKKFHTNHPEYTEERLRMILRNKDFK